MFSDLFLQDIIHINKDSYGLQDFNKIANDFRAETDTEEDRQVVRVKEVIYLNGIEATSMTVEAINDLIVRIIIKPIIMRPYIASCLFSAQEYTNKDDSVEYKYDKNHRIIFTEKLMIFSWEDKKKR